MNAYLTLLAMLTMQGSPGAHSRYPGNADPPPVAAIGSLGYSALVEPVGPPVIEQRVARGLATTGPSLMSFGVQTVRVVGSSSLKQGSEFKLVVPLTVTRAGPAPLESFPGRRLLLVGIPPSDGELSAPTFANPGLPLVLFESAAKETNELAGFLLLPCRDFEWPKQKQAGKDVVAELIRSVPKLSTEGSRTVTEWLWRIPKVDSRAEANSLDSRIELSRLFGKQLESQATGSAPYARARLFALAAMWEVSGVVDRLLRSLKEADAAGTWTESDSAMLQSIAIGSRSSNDASDNEALRSQGWAEFAIEAKGRGLATWALTSVMAEPSNQLQLRLLERAADSEAGNQYTLAALQQLARWHKREDLVPEVQLGAVKNRNALIGRWRQILQTDS